MDKISATKMANALLAEHGLDKLGWTFGFDNAQKRLGLCRFSVKRIQISQYFCAAADEEQVRQTLLHEVAHAMLPSGTGHSVAWKRQAAAIGYTGKRLAHNPHAQKQREQRAAAYNHMRSTSFAAPVNRPVARRGDTVIIVGGQRRLQGLHATVINVGSTRYKIEVPGQGVMFAPFSLVSLVTDDSATAQPAVATPDARPERVAAAQPIGSSTPAPAPAQGSRVAVVDGEHRGKSGYVMVNVDDLCTVGFSTGGVGSVPFGAVVRIVERGEHVLLVRGSQKYRGLSAKVISVGQSRYRAQVSGIGEMYVPFSLVVPVQDREPAMA